MESEQNGDGTADQPETQAGGESPQEELGTSFVKLALQPLGQGLGSLAAAEIQCLVQGRRTPAPAAATSVAMSGSSLPPGHMSSSALQAIGAKVEKLVDAGMDSFVKTSATELAKQAFSASMSSISDQSGAIATEAVLGMASGGVIPLVCSGANLAASAATLGVSIRVLQKVDALGDDVGAVKNAVEGMHYELEASNMENKKQFQGLYAGQNLSLEQLRVAENLAKKRQERAEKEYWKAQQRQNMNHLDRERQHQDLATHLEDIAHMQQEMSAQLAAEHADAARRNQQLSTQACIERKAVQDQVEGVHTVLGQMESAQDRVSKDMQQGFSNIQSRTDDIVQGLGSLEKQLIVGQEEVQQLAADVQYQMGRAFENLPLMLKEAAHQERRRTQEEDMRLLLSYYCRCLVAVQDGEEPRGSDVSAAIDRACKIQVWVIEHLNSLPEGDPRRLDWVTLYAYSVRAEAEVRQLEGIWSERPRAVSKKLANAAREMIAREAGSLCVRLADSLYGFAVVAAPLLAQYAVLYQGLEFAEAGSGVITARVPSRSEWQDGLDNFRKVFVRIREPSVPAAQSFRFGSVMTFSSEEASWLRDSPEKEASGMLSEEILATDMLERLGVPERQFRNLAVEDLEDLKPFLRAATAEELARLVSKVTRESFGLELCNPQRLDRKALPLSIYPNESLLTPKSSLDFESPVYCQPVDVDPEIPRAVLKKSNYGGNEASGFRPELRVTGGLEELASKAVVDDTEGAVLERQNSIEGKSKRWVEMELSLNEMTPADPGRSVAPPPAPAFEMVSTAVQPRGSGFGNLVAPPPVQTMMIPQPGEQPLPKPKENEVALKPEEVLEGPAVLAPRLDLAGGGGPLKDVCGQQDVMSADWQLKLPADAGSNPSLGLSGGVRQVMPRGFTEAEVGGPLLTGFPSYCYRLLAVKEDNMDNVIVRKVVLQRADLHALCNAFEKGSSELNAQRINFKSLENMTSVQVMGLFGCSSLVARFLHKHGLLLLECVSALPDGLYCCWEPDLPGLLYVFFWHGETSLQDLVTSPERVKLPGNMLRYLTELCDHVYICMEEASVVAMENGLPPSEAHRSTRVDFGLQKNGKNTLEAVASSLLEIRASKSSEAGEDARGATLVAGYSRVGLLESTVFPARPGVTHWKHSFSSVSELQAFVEDMSDSYNVFAQSEHILNSLLRDGIKWENRELHPGHLFIQSYERERANWPFRSRGKSPKPIKVSLRAEQTIPAQREWRFQELVPSKADVDSLLLPEGAGQRLPLRLHPLRTQTVGTFSESSKVHVILLKQDTTVEHGVEALVVVTDAKEMFIYTFGAGSLHVQPSAKPVCTFSRGPYELFAFDEKAAVLIAYSGNNGEEPWMRTLASVFFEDGFRSAREGGTVAIDPEDVADILWMELSSEVPNLSRGGCQLFFMDESLIIRTMWLGRFQTNPVDHGGLALESEGACFVPPGGDSILVLQTDVTSDDGPSLTMYSSELKELALSSTKLPGLTTKARSLLQGQSGLVTLHGQLLLVVLANPRPGYSIQQEESVHTLQIQLLNYATVNTTARDVTIDGGSGEGDKRRVSSTPELGLVTRIFERYAMTPKLQEDDLEHVPDPRILHLHFVLPDEVSTPANQSTVKTHLDKLLDESAKPRPFLTINRQASSATELLTATKGRLFHPASAVDLGTWIRTLACLVPIQIARAQRRNLVPLHDGLQLDMDGADSQWTVQTYRQRVRWGSYESILNSWKGNVVVVSSMGRQSSGKSYLLNHLFGCLFDVAGNRCTDGVWLSARPIGQTLYVALDFEGQGSQARFEQEDILMSWVNAAISSVTIFNTRNQSVDKDTLRTFSYFELGVHQARRDTGDSRDSKLFGGKLLLAVKDVASSGASEIRLGLLQDLRRMAAMGDNSWIGLMFQRELVLKVLPPVDSRDYYREQGLTLIAQEIRQVIPVYHSGTEFLNDLKLVLARAAMGDWDKMDRHRFDMRIIWLREQLENAVTLGQIDVVEDCPSLPEAPPEVQLSAADSQHVIELPDAGLDLSQLDSKRLVRLTSRLERVCQRVAGESGWFLQLSALADAVVERRTMRVMDWIDKATREYTSEDVVKQLPILNDLVRNFQTGAELRLQELKDLWTLCGKQCSTCHQQCLRSSRHAESELHDCATDHRCHEPCSACAGNSKALLEGGEETSSCSLKAGHKGYHDCREKEHTCNGTCHLEGKATACNIHCAKLLNHPGLGEYCECNGEHFCPEECSLPGCTALCRQKYSKAHNKHICNADRCIEDCAAEGCPRKCANPDHFHSTVPGALHICDLAHRCQADCEMPGNCDVVTSQNAVQATFRGRRSQFSYFELAEQNGSRLPCCKTIPKGRLHHDGPHQHSEDVETLHKCEARCPGCGYFCRLPMGHPEKLHQTDHGNMRKAVVAGEEDVVVIDEHTLECGEKGDFLYCHLFCKALGRGHIHLVECAEHLGKGSCLEGTAGGGARHETHSYGPDRDVPKDELTHEAFWRLHGFEDPTLSSDEQDKFSRCGRYCPAHDPASRNYCTQMLWHSPVAPPEPGKGPLRTVTADGHEFRCKPHASGHHLVFVVDKSSSMGARDYKPRRTALSTKQNNRLGCAADAVIDFAVARKQGFRKGEEGDVASLIVFGSTSQKLIEKANLDDFVEEMEKTIPSQLQRDPRFKGFLSTKGTNFTAGLEAALGILDASDSKTKPPVVVFLSDGQHNHHSSYDEVVARLKAQHPSIVIHTVLLSNSSADGQQLRALALLGNGKYKTAGNARELVGHFRYLADSIGETDKAALTRK